MLKSLGFLGILFLEKENVLLLQEVGQCVSLDIWWSWFVDLRHYKNAPPFKSCFIYSGGLPHQIWQYHLWRTHERCKEISCWRIQPSIHLLSKHLRSIREDNMVMLKLKMRSERGFPCLKPRARLNHCEVYPLNLMAIVVDDIHLIINWRKMFGKLSFAKVPWINSQLILSFAFDRFNFIAMHIVL